MTIPLATPGSCIELLAAMVGCPTVNPKFGGDLRGAAQLSAQIETWAGAWGLRSRRMPAGNHGENLLVSCEVSAEAPWLLFDSHLDTVAVDAQSQTPFQLREEGDRLYGRGSCDTKGSGAAMLWALVNYARGSSRPLNVGVLFTVDEESGMGGARAFAAQELTEFLPRLRGIVVGEPTQLNVVVATNGVMRWRTVTRGVAAHSSDPARGRSAITAMVKVVQTFEAHYVPSVTRTHPLTGKAVASVNLITGGTQVNVIPAYCAIECDRRLVPGETAAEALAARDRHLESLAPLEHSEAYVVPALSETTSQAFYDWAAPLFKSGGFDATPKGEAYVTNGSIYADHGAQVLVLGPGSAAQAHIRDEWVSKAQLLKAVEMYQAIMTGA